MLPPADQQQEVIGAVSHLHMPPPGHPLVQVPPQVDAAPKQQSTTEYDATITFYCCDPDGFCGTTASGTTVHPSTAACGNSYWMGMRFRIQGDPIHQLYICEDTGYLGANQVDIWFHSCQEGYAWQSVVGSHGLIEVLDGVVPDVLPSAGTGDH